MWGFSPLYLVKRKARKKTKSDGLSQLDDAPLKVIN